MNQDLFDSLLATLFQTRDFVHLKHLQIRPKGDMYGKHATLGEFYEALTNLIDRFAEVYMRQDAPLNPPSSITIPQAGEEEYILSLSNTIAKIIPGVTREDLKNILAEMQELCNHTLYKL